jgi:hypothetical protein
MDPNDIKEIVDAATPVATSASAALVAAKVYPDVIQPTAKKAGEALENVANLAATSLRSLNTIALAVNLLHDRLDGWLKEKLGGVPPENIKPPPANIAGPAVLQLAFIQDDERLNELRNLYVELLASAMNTARESLAHPAFVDVIKQLSPEEAKLLKPLSTHIATAGTDLPQCPIVRLKAKESGYSYAGEVFDVGLGPDFDTPRSSLDNLQRLGLIVVDYKRWLKGASYEHLVSSVLAKRDHITFDNGIIEVTDFGRRFLIACCGLSDPLGGRRA